MICGENKATRGVRCGPCADQQQNRDRSLRKKRRRRGVCSECGGELTASDREAGLVRCQSCRQDDIAYYHTTIAEGRCPHCGGPGDGHSRCRTCLDEQADYMAERRGGRARDRVAIASAAD